jgi:hypothetical protein
VNHEEDDARLQARAAEWPEDLWGLPDVARLAELSRREGLDFATALLYDRLLRVPANAAFLGAAQAAQGAEHISADLLGIVPGAFHRDHAHTGADGARVLAIAKRVGCEAAVIPLANFGTLEENAGCILDWLGGQRGRRIALLSLSKGGADVKQALAHATAADAFADVAAWISWSGMVQGTPLVAQLQRRPRWWIIRLILWWKRAPVRALLELRRGADSALEGWPRLPAHMRAVHVYGVPLRRHLTHRWAGRGYKRLSALGPNDGGGVLLGDLAGLPGIVCPIWGADHYLTPKREIESLLRGIVAAAVA